MKKKTVALLLAVMLAFGMTACGNKNGNKEEDAVESEALDEAADTQESEPEKEKIEIPEGYETMSNVAYDLGDYWTFSEDLNGTFRYESEDATEAFALYVQNETAGYTAENMIGAYVSLVEETYGTVYTTGSADYAGLEWTTMSYGSDNIMSPDVNVNVYIYSDGATTIYIEDAVNVIYSSFSGKMEDVLNSIIIFE